MATLVKSAMVRTNLSKKRPAPSVFYMPGLSSPSPDWTAAMTAQHPQIRDLLMSNYSTILQEYRDLRSSQQATPAPGGTGSSDYQVGLVTASCVIRIHAHTHVRHAVVSNRVYNTEHVLTPSSLPRPSQVDDQKLHIGPWDWQSYLLKGQRQASFAASCPRTADILESLAYADPGGSPAMARPALMTGTPLSFAFFSTMGGGAEIQPHYGACNLRIRCHFPLIVPQGDVGMECGGMRLTWQAGQPLFFDDAYEHRVWNYSTEERVVLLFDLWHPELEQEEIAALQDMFGYAKQQGWTKEAAAAQTAAAQAAAAGQEGGQK